MRKWTTALALVLTGVVSLGGCATAPKSAEGKASLGREVATALSQAKAQDPSLQAFLDKAYGYAVFPSVGKGAVGIGGAYGQGEVYERGRMIGYCDLSQATLGLQIGGQTYTEIIAFQDKAALENFKNGTMRFAGQATVVALKAGERAHASYTSGVSVLTMGEQGFMLEAAIGGQSFSFQPL